MKKIIVFTFCIALSMISLAQRPPGGRPGGGPEMMIEREKQALYSKVDDLSEDQKVLLDGIYDEFGITLKETFQAARESGSREGVREKMQALRKEKDELIKDVLNEEQFQKYLSIAQERRERRERFRQDKSTIDQDE